MYGTIVRRFAAPVSRPTATTISRQPPPTAGPRATTQPRSRIFKAEKTLSLERFLLRSRVLNLYRTIIRAIYQIPDKEARKDPVAHARGEFARNRDVDESERIRYLVSTGKAEWDGMRRYIDEMATRSRA